MTSPTRAEHRLPVRHRERGPRPAPAPAPATISARRAASSMRVDMDMDEAFARLAVAVAGLVGAPSACRLVALDREDRMHDQARTSRPRSVSSPITESTRNGMSSLTISITEIVLRCSPPPRRGCSKRTFGAPGLRLARNAQASRASAASSRGLVARPGPPARRGRTAAWRSRPAHRSCRRAAAGRPRRSRALRGALLVCRDARWRPARFMGASVQIERESSRPRHDCSGFARRRKGCRLPSTSCGDQDVPMKTQKKASKIKAKAGVRRASRAPDRRRTTPRSPRSSCRAASCRRRWRPISPSARRSSASCRTC